MLRYAVGRVRPYISGRLAPERVTVGDGGSSRSRSDTTGLAPLEYDEWWQRRGRYDRGSEENARWFSERTEVLTAFDRLDLRGDVLELAPGTGIWTERLT